MHWTAICILVSFLIQVGFFLQVEAKRKDSNGYKTTYACEGRTLHIECEDGIIHLIRANFGRFSISICNDHGNLDWSVNCMSHQSFLVMQERCSFNSNCSINVSSNTFYDPCPGTLKYLEVQYHCGKDIPTINMHSSTSSSLLKALLPVNTTTTFGPPPAVPSIAFTPTHTTLMPVTEGASVSIIKSYGKDHGKNVQEVFTPINTPSVANEDVLLREVLSSSTVDYTNANYCAPTDARGIKWMWTKAGEIAIEKCPDGATGTASWHCLLDTVEWNPEQPDLLRCRSMWLENLRERLQSGESIIGVTTELAEKSLAKSLFSADLEIISEIINQALYKSANSMENFLDTWHRYHVLRELLQCFVRILNNLLENKQSAAWIDLPSHERKAIISSILHGLDESALLLSEVSSDDGSFSFVKSNVLLSLQILNSKTLRSFHFPVRNEIHPDEKGITWLSMQDSLSLPRQAIKDYSSNGLYKVVFTAFNKLNSFLKPSSSFPYHSDDPSSGNVTRIINSKIIGASLDRGGYPKLHQPVMITLKHLIEENVTNPICVYWDFHFRDWSTKGCWVQISNRSHTVCFCEHLTNFAVIMDLRSDIVIPLDETLYIIIAVGGATSMIAFFITNIFMFTYDLDMPDDGSFIHKNIFLCLLFAESVFLLGNKDVALPLACAIMAGCLQYLLLATFSWMFIECYHQYGTVVRCCDVKKRSACWYYATAYIVPGLLTGITAAVSPDTYGSGHYCWLQTNNYFIIGFVTPAAVMILGGFVFIVLSVCMLSQKIVVTQEKDSVALIKHRSWNRRSLFLIISISITWILGVFFMSYESLFVAYTFSVLNSTHSVTLMILYCFCYERINNKESKDIRKIFSNIFWKKTKEQEHRPSEQSVVNSNEPLRSGIEQFRSLKQEKQKASTKACEDTTNYGSYKSNRGAMSCKMISNRNWKYASHHTLEGNNMDSSSSSECRQTFAVSPESSSQFFDHIYESIDERTTTSGQQYSGNSRNFPPPENYYGDHSDISQQSSSSSGYNRQTSQGKISDQGQNHYSLNRSPVQEQTQELGYVWEYKDSVSDKEAREVHSSSRNAQNEISQSSTNGSLWRKDAFQNWEPQLSNILPTENSVVLAVLEGDKVVSRIQQDDGLIQQQYKLSTYY